MPRTEPQSAGGSIVFNPIAVAFATTGHLRPVTWAILQEVIGVLAVLNALRAAFPPKVIHDLKAGPGLKTL